MLKDADMKLTCRQCGKQFLFSKAEQEFYELKGFSLPSHCRECRSARQNGSGKLACSWCGSELAKEANVYCTECLADAKLEVEIKTKKGQEAVSVAHTKLLAAESERAELAESLRRKEQLVTELEEKLGGLSQELEKAVQFHAALEWLQPILSEIAEKVGTLEKSQNSINEKMLQTIRVLCESYDNVALWDVIKRSLRQNQKQSA